MSEIWILIAGLAGATFFLRMAGYLLGARLPSQGRWAAGFSALPGCLITALLAVLLVQGGPAEWLAAGVAACVALISRSLPLTMLAGIAVIWVLRLYL